MCGRRSISKICSLRWLASCWAMTLPAKPAPTMSQSNTSFLPRNDGSGSASRRLRQQTIDLPAHRRPSSIPGNLRQMGIDLAQPVIVRAFEQEPGAGDEIVSARGNLDETLLAIGAHHVGNGRRYDGHARREELRCFRRADETGGFVDGEGHDAHIPA